MLFVNHAAVKKRRNIFIRLWGKAYRCAYQWNERRKTAYTLERLSSAQLKDIGLSVMTSNEIIAAHFGAKCDLMNKNGLPIQIKSLVLLLYP